MVQGGIVVWSVCGNGLAGPVDCTVQFPEDQNPNLTRYRQMTVTSGFCPLSSVAERRAHPMYCVLPKLDLYPPPPPLYPKITLIESLINLPRWKINSLYARRSRL
jgi:hypothetical protein